MSLLACPRCRAPWPAGTVCGDCGLEAADRGGVLDLCWRPGGPDPVTQEVNAFYEARPFPDYRDDDDRGTLLRRGRKLEACEDCRSFGCLDEVELSSAGRHERVVVLHVAEQRL